MGLSSLVETTTIASSMPLATASSTNSLTSRPRSPIAAKTAVSNLFPFPSMESKVDLPTPEPAKIPILCPAQRGVNTSIARTPVNTGMLRRLR